LGEISAKGERKRIFGQKNYPENYFGFTEEAKEGEKN
jgi:hypothetical protein